MVCLKDWVYIVSGGVGGFGWGIVEVLFVDGVKVFFVDLVLLVVVV